MKNTIPVSSLLHNKPHHRKDLWSISPDATVFEAIGLMADKNIGALPVVVNGSVTGIFTERDYTRKVALHGKSSKHTLVAEICSDRLISVTPQDSVEDCMRLMTENRVRHLPVLEGKQLVGIVSIGDLVNWIISMQNVAIEQMEQYIAGSATA